MCIVFFTFRSSCMMRFCKMLCVLLYAWLCLMFTSKADGVICIKTRSYSLFTIIDAKSKFFDQWSKLKLPLISPQSVLRRVCCKLKMILSLLTPHYDPTKYDFCAFYRQRNCSANIRGHHKRSNATLSTTYRKE